MGIAAEMMLKEFKEVTSKFMEDTEGENELQVILRGHLYLENEIERLLRFVLVEPDFILTERFMFMNKVNLAFALGLIPKDRIAGYKKINKIRNEYAHKLDFEITEKDASDILSVLPKEVKALHPIPDDLTVLESMRFLLRLLWADSLMRSYEYEVSAFEKAMKEIDDIELLKENPPGKEELQQRRDEIVNKLERRFRDKVFDYSIY
ncbi:hypothetical protein [Bacillus wiedmannii]|uniref:hypothetical protein n=1 Tax=Bacillus wiedmannii TaxID=1890302 RepID=UPI000BFB9ED8|nr:hypothetical protein [Bacillus wiedmannii]PHA61734.1 hypothetical protein COE75_18035 [Bacillus wiedmannii]